MRSAVLCPAQQTVPWALLFAERKRRRCPTSVWSAPAAVPIGRPWSVGSGFTLRLALASPTIQNRRLQKPILLESRSRRFHPKDGRVKGGRQSLALGTPVTAGSPLAGRCWLEDDKKITGQRPRILWPSSVQLSLSSLCPFTTGYRLALLSSLLPNSLTARCLEKSSEGWAPGGTKTSPVDSQWSGDSRSAQSVFVFVPKPGDLEPRMDLWCCGSPGL